MFIMFKFSQKSAFKLFSNSITLSHDIRLATHDEWHVTCDTLRMTHDTLRVTHDTWQMGGGEAPDMCHLTLETWHETQDTYHMICDTYLWENNLSKFQLPNFYSLGVNIFSRFEGNGSGTEFIMNELMTKIFLTVPAMMGLLKSITFTSLEHTDDKNRHSKVRWQAAHW